MSNRALLTFSFLIAFTSGPVAADEATDIFLRHVLPTFKEKCAGCHNTSAKKSGLSLATLDDLMHGGKRGRAIVPGSPGKSLLVIALEQETALKMPPGQRLPNETIGAIRRWIELGAPWSDQTAAPAPVWKYSSEDAWEFQPVKPVAVPASGDDKSPVLTPVDAFILAKLRQKNLRTAPRADRVALLRRATFDLTGLPPTPGEVAEFVHDPAPDQEAFRKVVERLLASPRYGEKWGRHWLDVVRYADTAGYSNDFERPHAWRYRDYVIRSFNRDKPYNQFIREQIAGDEIDPKDSEKLVATGFLRMGPWEHTAMSVAAETRQAWLDDVTHSIGASFLGLTLECARCHDHKFDPIPTKDYYRLQAIFATTEFADRPASFLPGEEHSDFAAGRARLEEMVRRNKAKIAEFEQIVKARIGPAAAGQDSHVSMESIMDAVKTKKLLTAEEWERYKVFEKRNQLYERSVTRYDPIAYSISDSPFLPKDREQWSPPDVFILPVGNLKTPGEKVTPGLPGAPMHYASWSTADVPATIGGRRLALADWIADPKNPLTARVMVNRIWRYHFGGGIAGNPNNLGKMGEKPTHPELLDWLANYFMTHGWSVKEMHRVIMMSAAYQRSSECPDRATIERTDPENKLLSYFSPRRLEAEELRDGMLYVAGELSFDTGGPGTFPEINTDVANQPQQIMGTLMPAYHPSQAKRDRNRRTIYTFQKRNLINPFIDVFNGPSLDESTERRLATTVPTQVFSLFNSQFTHDTALEFAVRLSKLDQQREARIADAFRLALNRAPTDTELRKAEVFLDRRIEAHRRSPPPAQVPRKPLVRSITSELTGAEVPIQEDDEIGSYEENVQASAVSPEVRALAELTLVLFNSNEFLYVY